MSPPVMTLPARNFKFLNEGITRSNEKLSKVPKKFSGLPSETSFRNVLLRWGPKVHAAGRDFAG
jgi:hypothetical protein